MSVNTSEEYLDELLQAIEPIVQLGEPEPAITPIIEEEIVEEVIADEEVIEAEELVSFVEDMGEASAISDLLTSLEADDADIIDESDMPTDDVDLMLDTASNRVVTENTAVYDEDVKELLKQFTDDEDLSDIQDILDKNDNGEALDNSMLELPDVEVFQVEEENDDEDSDNVRKSNSIGKLIGNIAGLFKKRKNKKSADVQEKVIEDTFGIAGEAVEEFESEETTDFTFGQENEVSLEDLFGEDTDDVFFDEDLSDIEQLLTGGTLVELDVGDKNDVSTDKASKVNAEEKKRGKKESLFTKIMNVLTEELDEPDMVNRKIPEVDRAAATDENVNILKELSAEDKKRAKKAKKEEKRNKKAAKKGKNASEKGDNDEDNGKAQDSRKAKKEKKRKEKIDKKLKPRKVEEITGPERKLPKKRVISTLALCFSILAAVLILQSVVTKSDNLKEAKIAFANGDYATCYANLGTIERNEEENALYQKSLVIMTVQRKWDAYNNFVIMNNELEALNSLLEGVAEYRSIEETSFEWGVHAQITVIYQNILEALQGYGLSQSDIDEILGYESKVTYTKRLDSIVNGTPFVIEEMSEGTFMDEAQPLQDVLPGEEDFLPEDTTLINETSAVTELSEEKPVEVQEMQPSGETVVVGSNPVDVSAQNDVISYDEAVVVGGQNVGSGNMNMSVEVNGQNALIGVQ